MRSVDASTTGGTQDARPMRYRPASRYEGAAGKAACYRTRREKKTSSATSVSPSIVRISNENTPPKGWFRGGTGMAACSGSRNLLCTKSVSSDARPASVRRSPASKPAAAWSRMLQRLPEASDIHCYPRGADLVRVSAVFCPGSRFRATAIRRAGPQGSGIIRGILEKSVDGRAGSASQGGAPPEEVSPALSMEPAADQLVLTVPTSGGAFDAIAYFIDGCDRHAGWQQGGIREWRYGLTK